MVKTSVLNIRLEPEVKSRAEELFAAFGISLGDAVNLFLHQSLLVGGLPFKIRHPRFNRETENALQEARQIAAGIIASPTYKTAQALFDELDREC